MNGIHNSAAILYVQGNKPNVVVVATLFGMFLAGTGGNYSQNNMELVSTWTSVPAIAISSAIDPWLNSSQPTLPDTELTDPTLTPG